MKLITLILTLLLLSTTSITSQTEDECLDISLKKKDIKNSEYCISELCYTVLNTSFEADSQDLFQSQLAQLTILKWTEKSEFNFVLSQKMMDLCESDYRLIGIYIASMAKAAIELQSNHFQEKAIGYFAEFIRNKALGVKQTKRLKKFIANYRAGEIEQYLEKDED
ncbi:MAG: hypothetical protein ACI9N1_002794 [Flavobacteriales bacterium]|jgi:hypothetical protein